MNILKNERKMISDGILLTLTTLALKTAGVMFSAKLTLIAGAEAMGLSSQINAVYAFAVTAAAAGVNLGTMRLTSESRGAKNDGEIRAGVKCALSYCIKTGTIVAFLLFLLAPSLSVYLMGNRECILPLRILAVAIPCISMSGAFHGYFNGVRKVYKSAAVNVIEQLLRITLTLGGLYGISSTKTSGLLSPIINALSDKIHVITITLSELGSPLLQSASTTGTVQYSTAGLACIVLVLGSVSSELCSCLILAVLYLFDRKRYQSSVGGEYASVKHRLQGKFLRITVPMAVSALIRTGLSSAEHLLLPRGLRIYGSENALAEYGIVCGMALPVILYPMALMNAFAQLNTPDIAARVSAGESRELIRERVKQGISFALIYGIGCAALLKAFAYSLGEGIFHSTEAGTYISLLSIFAVLSYLDHITDSMLKGLDQQGYVMKINILDSALGVLCALILVPRFGINGYIVALYLCEFLNCLCSIGRLIKVTGFFPSVIKSVIVPLVCAFITVNGFSLLILDSINTVHSFFLTIPITAAVYFLLVFIMNKYVSQMPSIHKKHTAHCCKNHSLSHHN